MKREKDSGGLFFFFLFMHACMYAERRRLGWGVAVVVIQPVEALRLDRKALVAIQCIHLFKRLLAALNGRMK